MDALTDPRFGRCSHFVVVDTESMECESIENAAAVQGSGAGIAAAQAVANAGATAVIAGNIGPNAYRALAAGGIRVFASPGGTVREAVEQLVAGHLTEMGNANVAAHFGTGMGSGPGGGRGMGMGGGMGMM
jgi:predicted Fe-Mo cluster-binding NifX family protein